MGKAVKLRAFKITISNFADNQSKLFGLLSSKLTESAAKDRRMLLNEHDPDKEEDLICDYQNGHDTVFGAVLRIRNSENIPAIPDDIFEGNTIHLEQLDGFDVNSSVFYKNHYYFLISNDYLIVNLKGQSTITHFQTYINWLLGEERGDELYEFTPVVKEVPDLQLNDINRIKIQDPARKETDAFDLTETKKLSFGYLSHLLKDVASLDEVKLSEVVSAELLIKFKKPKKMTQEDYQNSFGAYLKPIADTENVTFYPKKGAPINGSDILAIKDVSIEETDSGKISEPQLRQEMERYLRETSND